DLYTQLHDALENLGTLKLNESNADYDAIHRSILAGLTGHVARREERNNYKAGGNRVLNVFPGSALFERGEPSKKHAPKPDRSAPVEDNLEPKIVQRRFRPSSSPLAAEIDDDESGVPPSGSDAATESHRFLAHNRAVRQKIENWQTRVRRYDLADLDQAMFDFYTKHLENISSTHDLNRLLREQTDPDFLCVHEADLAGGPVSSYDTAAFPDTLPVGGQPVALAYAYAPGEDHDGVTIQLPFSLAQTACASLLEWAVPGLREEKISTLLRALPKAIRRNLMPFPPKVAEIVRDFKPAGASFLADLGRFLE